MNTKNFENNMNDLSVWYDLIKFQLNIAQRWLDKGNEAKDIFAKFFFYFVGFNALYFLWSEIDKVGGKNEGKYIENLLKKFDKEKAEEILNKTRGSIDYFLPASSYTVNG